MYNIHIPHVHMVCYTLYYSDENDDEGVDKRMGEVSKEDTEEKDDELDRNLWAPEEDEEEDKDVRYIYIHV